MERPTPVNLGMLRTHDGREITVIEESANHYRRIGPILLNDRYGEHVETIESDKRGKGERIIKEIYKKWMREDVNYSWIALAECFRECHLYHLANNIEQHFGIPSPPLPQSAATAPAGITLLYTNTPYTKCVLLLQRIQLKKVQ